MHKQLFRRMFGTVKGAGWAASSAWLLLLTGVPAHASITSYALNLNDSTDQSSFGTLNFSTGAFTAIGSPDSQSISGLGVDNGILYTETFSGNFSTPAVLYSIDTGTGDLTAINPSTSQNLQIGTLGSTLSGLYSVGVNNGNWDLYSVNPSTGTMTDIGGTGITAPSDLLVSFFGLSTNSSTLYFSMAQGNGVTPVLYTLNTSTGLGTEVGSEGSLVGIDSLLEIGGTLYGGDDVNNNNGNSPPQSSLATLAGNGTASNLILTDTTGLLGLAEDPLPDTTPEPRTWLLLCSGLAALAIARRHRTF